MAKSPKAQYVCTECGSSYPVWYGKCPNCQKWNTLAEEFPTTSTKTTRKSEMQSLDTIPTDCETRMSTGLSELDRVLGGGIVKGSAVLIGGEPGAGKSTLLLQLCGNIEGKTLYFSGEESTKQIKLRADRLGINGDKIYISNETDIEKIVALIASEKPVAAVVDSIQTMRYNEVDSAAGSVTQIRECTSILLDCAKSKDIPVFIVGHVNKDGAIAGPKIIEHIVDTVLYFEGDRYLSYRILRAAKNRFGSTNELGLFGMSDKGLECVLNPSAMLLEGRNPDISGSSITCVVEGTRPILCELQVLATKSAFQVPRRTSSGFDYNRTNLLLAVIEKRAGLSLGSLDVYVNVVGGISLVQPAADLAFAASAVSALMDKPVPRNSVFIGEIGLGGEVRSVANISSCLAEIARLGYEICYLPKNNKKNISDKLPGLELVFLEHISELAKILK